MFCVKRFIAVVLIMALMSSVVGCGGGGIGAIPGTNPTSIPVPLGQISAIVKPPTGVFPSSLSIISDNNPIIIPSANGEFNLNIRPDRTQIVSAMFPEKVFAYMAVITDTPPDGSKLVIDETTTAEALLFSSPLLLNSDPAKARTILNEIRNDSNFSDLVTTVHNISSNPDPLETPEFNEAYNRTLTSILNRLNATSFSSVSLKTDKEPVNTTKVIKLPSSAEKGGGFIETHNEHLFYTSLDVITDLDKNEYKIDLKGGQQAAPVEWVANLAEIEKSNFPKESIILTKTVYTRTPDGLSQMANFHGEHTALFKYLEWTDFIDKLIDTVADFIGTLIGWATHNSDDCFHIPRDRDAIYIVRIYNGMAWSVSDEDLYFEATIPGGSEMHQHAWDKNYYAALFDVADLWLGAITKLMKEELGNDALGKLVNVYIDGLKEYKKISPDNLQDQKAAADNLFAVKVLVIIVKEFLKLLDENKETLLKDYVGIQLKLLSATAELALGSIPKTGSLIERLAWDFGMQTNLESAIIVVGDPFSPTDLTPTPDPNTGTWNPIIH